MMTTDLDPFSSATDMLRALRERRVSAVELLELYLARIARYNPALTAIVTSNDNARRDAVAADDARARGADRPLLGLPLTIKDCIDVAGLRGTAGVPTFADRVPTADAPVVARLRASGAVIVGKTNVPPYAGDWQTDNRLFGRTNNPYDLARTPGGSTGGGGAALAAGLTPLEFGSDIGGSIRIPAAFCGVYGHRPSETALPRSGHFPGSPLPNPAALMTVQGPLARAAADLELALAVAAGPDTGEDAAWRLDVSPARHERLSGYRVAVLPPLDWLPVDDEITAALDTLAATLRRAGATVAVAAPEGFGDLRDYYALYRSLLWVSMSVGWAEERRVTVAEGTLASPREGSFGAADARGLRASATDYLAWASQRERYRAAYRDFFRAWDILLAPATPCPAFAHLDAPFEQRKLDINGRVVAYDLMSAYPAVATLAGQPSTAFPVGFTPGGLPIGLQAIGPYLEDRTPIRFAALVAEEIGGFQRPTGYE
jgi:amidase